MGPDAPAPAQYPGYDPYAQQAFGSYYGQVYGYDSYWVAAQAQQQWAQAAQTAQQQEAEPAGQRADGAGRWRYAALLAFVAVASAAILLAAGRTAKDIRQFQSCEDDGACVPRCCGAAWTCVNVASLERGMCADQAPCMAAGGTLSACACVKGSCGFAGAGAS